MKISKLCPSCPSDYPALFISMFMCFVLLPGHAASAEFNLGTLESYTQELKKVTVDGIGNHVSTTYFIAHPERSSDTVILFVQGSGCEPSFTKGNKGSVSTSIFGFATLSETAKVPVIVVEKPNSASQPTATPGLATNCPLSFNRSFDLPSWTRTIRRAIEDYQSQQQRPLKRIDVIGSSEGATVGTALAKVDRRVKHIALLGASGPSQYFDLIANVYRDSRDQKETSEQLVELQRTVERINRHPNAHDRLIWGHPYKRWSSFLRESSLQNLLQSRAKVLLIAGMNDLNVPIVSTEALYAELVGKGRDVQIRRIPGAAHDLSATGMDTEFRHIVEWFQKDESSSPHQSEGYMTADPG